MDTVPTPAPAERAHIKTWQERCDWLSDQPATKLMVEAMKAEIADLRVARTLSGLLAVGTHVDKDAVTVVVHLKQGDQTTVLYSRKHSPDGDGFGVVALQASREASL